METERDGSSNLVVEKISSSLTAIIDPESKTVYSLNATAAAAWEACAGATTLGQVVSEMQRSLNSAVTEDIALEALLQLRERRLVRPLMPLPTPVRQSMPAVGTAVLPPLVLAFPSADPFPTQTIDSDQPAAPRIDARAPSTRPPVTRPPVITTRHPLHPTTLRPTTTPRHGLPTTPPPFPTTTARPLPTTRPPMTTTPRPLPTPPPRFPG